MKSFARLFFRKKEKRMQSKVRPSSKSPTKNSRHRVIKSRASSDGNDDECIDNKDIGDGDRYRRMSDTRRSFQSTSTSTSSHSSTSEITGSSSGTDLGTSRKSSGKLCCDKCDGKHVTEQCPYYKTKRGSHPDEQKNFYKKLGGISNLPGQTLRSARVVRQPGDGSCLFHSMSYGKCNIKAFLLIYSNNLSVAGLSDGTSASSLRRQICAFIARNPKLLIADTPLSDWVKWDSRGSVTSYVAKMSCGTFRILSIRVFYYRSCSCVLYISYHIVSGAWGGGIEMACMSLLKNCNVHVYERSRLGYTRISAFDHPSSPERKKTVKVLYGGGIHYGEYGKYFLYTYMSMLINMESDL